MNTVITNNGASLKITTDGVPRDIIKNQIREISVLYGNIIKIDIGEGALYNIYIDKATVTAPANTDVNDLREQLLAMLAASAGSTTGLATEQKQTDEITKLTAIADQVTDVQSKLASMDNKAFYEPLITDENNPNMIYKGYALPGAITGNPVWAIERVVNSHNVLTSKWALGNKNLDKIWDNRAGLDYL